MSDTAWIAFGAAFGGALVGGIASTAGTAILDRRSGRRSARVRLYLEDLPRVRSSLDVYELPRSGGERPLPPEVSALVRHGNLAPRSERKKIGRIEIAWWAWASNWRERTIRDQKRRDLDGIIHELDEHLKSKLAG